MTYEDMLRAVRRRQIDIVAITDHDTIDGALEFQARNAQRTDGITIVVGEEKTLADGSHVSGLFLKERIYSEKLVDAIEEIREQEGIPVIPHPFRHHNGALQAQSMAELPASLCFEIFNPKCNRQENAMASDLLKGRGVLVGGSDAHYAGDLGECLNIIPTASDPCQSLRLALTAKLPLAVWGIRQASENGGRQYAPFYYRIKPFVRIPPALVPLASRLYRLYRNRAGCREVPKFELKHELD